MRSAASNKTSAWTYFALQGLIGSRVKSRYAEFLDAETWTPEHLSSVRDERLARILKHAASRIPFYRERVTAAGQRALADFPILTKADVRQHFMGLMTPDVAAQHARNPATGPGYSWIEVKTGGSTGMPTTVIHDREMRDRGRAGRLYSQRLCGFPIGTPYVRLWGAMGDINQSKVSLQHKVMNALSGELLLNAFRMNDDDMTRYLADMRASGLRHAMAYVDAMEQLALFAERRGLASPRLDSIMACAGTVTADTRAHLGRVFGARVHNQYGSRDCTGMACECERGGHHIYTNQLLLEVVDDAGRPVAHGTSGRILVTLLFNDSFPLIRYEIGDVGALRSEACPCGRPFPLLDRVEGRKLEMLSTTNGGYVSPVYLRHLIGVVHNPGLIRRFQMIQETPTEYRLRVECDTAAGASAFDHAMELILRDLKTVLGPSSNVHVERASNLEETPTGKFLYTINKTAGRAT